MCLDLIELYLIKLQDLDLITIENVILPPPTLTGIAANFHHVQDYLVLLFLQYLVLLPFHESELIQMKKI